MIEKATLDYLSRKLTCPVVMERDGETAPFVLIKKTGSGRENRINSAMITLQSYGETLYKAAELNKQVIDKMSSMIELDAILKSSLNSDYNFTDPETKEYRYQALFDVKYLMEE